MSFIQNTVLTLLLITVIPLLSLAQHSPYDMIDWNEFELLGQTGQNLPFMLSDFRIHLPQPDEETTDWNENFGTYNYLTYGTSKFSFVEDFGLYHFIIRDSLFFVRLNGVEIRVGNQIQKLAEHFPKSWSFRTESGRYPELSSIYFPVGDSGLVIVFETSSGLIKEISFSSRLT